MAVMTHDDVMWGARDEVRPVPVILPADLPVARILAWAGAIVAGGLVWAGVGLALSLAV